MIKYPVLKNSPITEALLDIQVDASTELDLEVLEHFQDDIDERFPTKYARNHLQVQAKLTDEAEVSHSVEHQGYIFQSLEEPPSKVVQARLDGFTFSKLKPYENWDVFRDEARELWGRYVSITHPKRVIRLGLRTINRIELPLPFNDFRDFLLTGPEIAAGIKQSLAEYFVRLVIPYEEFGATAIVTVATVAAEASEVTLPMLLDIDVFSTKEMDPTADEIWQACEQLRGIKNEIFFNTLTPAAKELFE